MASSPAPVSLCLIVKDEPKLREFLTPARPSVKQIAVLDTGSSLEHLKALRALESEGIIDTLRIGGPGEFDYYGVPIDFAKARNASFDLATQPWVLWMDGDDEIVGLEKLGAIIAEYEGYRPYNPGAEFEISFPYEYSYDAQGRVELEVERGRLLSRRAAWNWCWVVHESICAVPGQGMARFSRTDVVWKHRRQQTGKDGAEASRRNWALLEKYWEHDAHKGPTDARMALYTGMTLKDLGRFDEAAKYFKLAIANYAIDEDIVVAALRYVGALLAQGKTREALVYAFMAARAKESWGQGWIAIAQIYKHIAEHEEKWTHGRTLERLVHFGRLGLALPYAKWFGDPRDRLDVMIGMSIALDRLSRYAEALEICEAGLKEYPGDPTLEGNRDLMYAVVEGPKLAATAARLRGIGARGGAHLRVFEREASSVARALGAAGGVAGSHQDRLGPPAEELLPLREDGQLRILFACGKGWQPWNPKIVESAAYRGGGSEIAVVELSRQLAALGHDVTVATDCGEPGDYDRVHWVPAESLGVPQKTDVLICWRYASHVNFPIAARLRVLWCHDVLAHNAAADNLGRYDRIVGLSAYHKACLLQNHPELAPEKIVVSRWGASALRFGNQTRPRNVHKAVWTSSPDRGVVHLLENWATIRKAVPDAELHIFYGWDMWEKAGTDPFGLAHVQHLVRTLKDAGVVYRERVNSDELATELLTAGVWAYPCTFPEIFCVAAVEAQMAGLRCIATPAGALVETMVEGVGVTGDPGAPGSRASFRDLIVEAMTADESPKWKARHLIAHHAQGAFDLAPIGKEWQDHLRGWLAEKIELPPFESALAAAE